MKVKYKIALIIPITIVLGVLVKTILPEPLVNEAHTDYCWMKKTHASEQFNIAVIGDSRIYRGVNPEALQNSEKKSTAANFGYSSGGYSNEYLTFVSSRLKTEGERFIVCGITPFSFTREALKNEHYHSFLKKDRKEVFKALYLSGFMKYFPIYSPSEIKEYLSHSSAREGYFQEYKENGWVKSYKVPSDSTFALSAYRKNFMDNPVNEQAIKEFLTWVGQKTKEKVHVVGFRPPSTVAMERLEDSLSGFDYDQFQQEFENNGGVWLEYPSKEYTSYDGSHLEYQSAEKLSKKLKLDLDELF